LWGETTVCALDAGGATYTALGDGKTLHAIVILDPEGKIVHRSTDIEKGNSYYAIEGKPYVPFADLKKAIEGRKGEGLLGGVTVPERLAPITAAIKQGQLAKAQAMLTKVRDSGESGAFKAELTKRLDELAQKKLALFESLLSEGRSWDAYKVGASYLRCFPDGKGAAGVKEKMTALKSNAEVKKQVDAREAFRKAALALCGPKPLVHNPAQVQKVFRKLATEHDGTEYGTAAKAISEREITTAGAGAKK
jgi:hypothetical protein